MATTSSQHSQPGPSSGMRSPANEFNSTECFSELVDLLALTFDDDPRETPGAGTRIRDFLRDNKLTVVPTTGTLDEHEVQKRNLRKEVETLSQQLRTMDELSQELSDKDKLAKELERKMKGVEARFERMTEEIQGLRRRCAHIEAQNRILLQETANKEEKYNLEKRKLDDERKKVVRDREGINRKMDALNQQVLQAQKEAAEEKGKSETIFKDKDVLVGQVKQLEERLRQEKAESARRIQQEQERAQRFQENMLKRNQDVINLKNEKEEWTREKMRFRVFLKELSNRCGCPVQEGDKEADLLLESEQGLNDMMTKIEQILNARNQEKLDMERKMTAVQQLQGFLSQAQELAQYLQTGSSSSNNIPDAPASVSDSVETCSTTDAMIPAFGTTTSGAENESLANNQQTSVRPDSPFRSMDTSLINNQSDNEDLESRPGSPPIAVIVGVSTVAMPNAGNSNCKSTLPPTPPPEEARSPRKRPSSPDPPTPSKRGAFQNPGIFTVHNVQMMVDSLANVQSQNTPATPAPVQPQVPPSPSVPLIVITPPHSTVGNSSTSCNRPLAEIVATPRPEAPRGPSIVVPLIERPTPAQALPVLNPLPSPPSSTATTPQQVQPEPEQCSNRRMSNGSRLYKQFTPFSPNTKQHGINRARAHHTCLCGNIYQNEKGLKVHIRKMTKEWKYKCGACLQYFFYQSDLSRHLKVAAKCSKNVSNGDSQGSFTHFLEDLLATPPDAVQPPPAANSTPSTSTRKGSSRKNASPRSSKRKLQQSIFRNKKHVPWSKQTVSGSWMCSCGSKFSSKCNLEMHSQYFTREWQFRCEQCPGKYFFLSYLKKHMKDSHGIQDAFKEYRLGCHLCGEMFVGRKDYYVHRKLAHDEHTRPARRARGLMSQLRGISSQVPEAPQSSTSNNPVATSSVTAQDVYNISTVDDDQEDVTVVRVVRPSPSPTKLPSAIPATPKVAPPPPPQDSPPQAPPSQAPSSSSSSSSPSNSSSQKKHAPVQQDPLSIDSDEAELFRCQCGKTYLSKTALNHHIKKMTVGSIYVCLKCSRSFQELCNLKTHMRTIHEESYKGFSCGKCKKRFVNALVFEKHRREEHDELSETSYDTDIDMLD